MQCITHAAELACRLTSPHTTCLHTHTHTPALSHPCSQTSLQTLTACLVISTPKSAPDLGHIHREDSPHNHTAVHVFPDHTSTHTHPLVHTHKLTCSHTLQRPLTHTCRTLTYTLLVSSYRGKLKRRNKFPVPFHPECKREVTFSFQMGF